MKTTKIVVEVSPEQARLFAVLAEKSEAAPGEIMLALACDRLNSNPASSTQFPDTELAAHCWTYVGRRQLPDASEWLGAQQIKDLGFETTAVEVSHV